MFVPDCSANFNRVNGSVAGWEGSMCAVEPLLYGAIIELSSVTGVTSTDGLSTASCIVNPDAANASEPVTRP